MHVDTDLPPARAAGRRVNTADVAAKAGVKITEAEAALRALAADTAATVQVSLPVWRPPACLRLPSCTLPPLLFQVSEEGDIVYVFPRDFRSTLAARSLALRLQPLLAKAAAAGDYLLRVTFGTTLLARRCCAPCHV